MKTLSRSLATVAVLGAAVLLLQGGDGNPVSQPGADQTGIAASASVTDRTSSVSAAPQREDAIYSQQNEIGRAVATNSTLVAATSQTVSKEAKTHEARKQAAQAKMSGPVAALAISGGNDLADVIVSYNEHPELFEDGRVESLGGEVLRHYEVLKLLAIRIPAGALVDLAIDDDVRRVSLDEAVTASSTASRVAANVPVSPSSNVSYDGYRETVAVLDTGVAVHDDLGYFIQQFSFLDGAYPVPQYDRYGRRIVNSDPRVDGYGHGTHVASVIAGNGSGSFGEYRGLAGAARVLSLQVLDANGQGQMSDVMAALDWLLAYGDDFDVSVANLSFGKPITESITTDPLVAAVEAVWDSGIVVVVAAGNFGREGYFSITSPGNSRKVITVGSLTDNGTGSLRTDDYVSTYSSRGPTAEDHVVKPDLVAPGNRVVAAVKSGSTLATLLPGNVVACYSSSWCSDDYLELSGTSMSAAMVSAAAAMMLDKEHWLSPATVKARLMRSARKIDESPVVAGAGLLDIDAAMNETGFVYGQALSPLVSYQSETGGTLIQDTAQLWGNDIWGAGYLWTDGIAANGYLWTDGTGLSASGYLWTDGGLWANGYLWTDGGVAAFGYLWTDGVRANGYLWTDGGLTAKGYLWTDGGTGFRAMSLYDLWGASPGLNDDENTAD